MASQTLPSSTSPALKFEDECHASRPWACSLPSCMQVVATQGRARASRMTLPHYTAETPMFMPVGTQVKAGKPGL
eukprot:108495-Pelagomonas_calceolata.AAC.1